METILAVIASLVIAFVMVYVIDKKWGGDDTNESY